MSSKAGKALWLYWGIVRRWGWLLVISIVVPALVANYLASGQPDFYQAKATLMVGTGLQNPDPDPWQLTTANNLANAYARLAQEGPIVNAVIAQLGLDRSPSDLAAQISTRVYPEAQLLEIQVVDQDPRLAADIANALAEELVRRSPVSQEDEQKRREFIRSQLDELEARIEQLDGQISQLRETLPELTSAAELEEAQQRLEQLEAARADNQATYAALLSSSRLEAPNALSVFEQAAEPATPLPRRTMLSVAVAAVAGLGLAIAGVVVVERLDDTVRWERVEDATFLEYPVLGAVPRVRVGGERLVRTLPLRQADLEALRELRTSLLINLERHFPAVVVSVSPGPRAGKTFLVALLGQSLAELGLRTLVIDGNMRRPALHEWFDQPNLGGLSELLTSGQRADAAWTLIEKVPTGIEDLYLLPAGPPPVDPLALLVGDELRALLDGLRAGVDVILIDSPAGLLAPDALLLTRPSDGVLVVCSHRTTRSKSLEELMYLLREQGPSVPTWIAFNRVPRSHIRLHPTSRRARQPSLAHQQATFTVREAARLLGVRSGVVRRWLRSGRLKAERVRWSWVIQREELERFSLLGLEVGEADPVAQQEPTPLN